MDTTQVRILVGKQLGISEADARTPANLPQDQAIKLSDYVFAYIAKNINLRFLPLLGYLALLPMIGFIYIYLTGSRQTGAEVFGAKIWWNNLRPIHALLYGLFAYYAIQRSTFAWKFLLADVLIGFFAFMM
jgi:hypothetical protein